MAGETTVRERVAHLIRRVDAEVRNDEFRDRDARARMRWRDAEVAPEEREAGQ